MDRGRLVAAALPVTAIAVLLAVTGAAAAASWQAGTLGFDFQAYDLAVRRFLDGGVLYDQSYDATGGFGLFYYLPSFVLLAAPFAVLDPALATWIFTALLVLVFAVGVAILPVSRTIRWVILLLGGLSWPLVYAIKLGQVGPILFLAFALGWRWMDRPWRLGAAAAIGTAIKLQPALLFGWMLLTGRRRAVVLGLGVLAVLVVVATLVTGPSAWVDQAALLARVSKPIDTPHNLTPGRLAFEAGLGATAAWIIQIANWALVAVVVLWATLRCAPVASYLAFVVASQLLSPILWDHYALMLLLPVAWLLSRGHRWAVLVPLATSVPAVGLIPPATYLVCYWVTLLAVVFEGRTRPLPQQPLPEAGAILAG
jgi:hypothetical protein